MNELDKKRRGISKLYPGALLPVLSNLLLRALFPTSALPEPAVGAYGIPKTPAVLGNCLSTFDTP